MAFGTTELLGHLLLYKLCKTGTDSQATAILTQRHSWFCGRTEPVVGQGRARAKSPGPAQNSPWTCWFTSTSDRFHSSCCGDATVCMWSLDSRKGTSRSTAIRAILCDAIECKKKIRKKKCKFVKESKNKGIKRVIPRFQVHPCL